MKTRTSKAPAGKARRKVTQYGSLHTMVRYMRASIDKYGSTVSTSCTAALRALGFSNRFSPSTQAGLGSAGRTLASGWDADVL
jgi:hypothetical protein